MTTKDIEEFAMEASKNGKRLLLVDLGNNPSIATTDNPKMIADQIGEAIALAAELFHSMAGKEGLNLSQKEVFDAVIYASFARATKIFKSKERLRVESA